MKIGFTDADSDGTRRLRWVALKRPSPAATMRTARNRRHVLNPATAILNGPKSPYSAAGHIEASNMPDNHGECHNLYGSPPINVFQ